MLTGERLTSRDLEAMQRRAAGALLGKGLTFGDRVVIVATSSASMIATILGALRVGIVPVLISPLLLEAEQDVLIADADPPLVLRDEDLVPVVEGEAAAELAPFPLARPMHFTSGTTGRPKAVWSGLFDEQQANDLVVEERELWHFDASDVNLVCSPLHHSAPLRFAMGTLLAGGEIILLPRFDAEAVAHMLDTEAPTSMFCVPTHLQRLFSLPSLPSTASLRLLAHAGAPCPIPLKRRALESFPAGTVWEFYGSTEGQFTACAPDEWLERPGTVGKARPNRSLMVDSDDMIWCHVPRYARFEYWRAPEKTAAAWRGNAFTVGDLGRLDRAGYLFLDGRRDDLIITGGVNVYPVEVEQVIEQLAGVVSVAVFGVDDDHWGQRVCAAVIGDVSSADVIEHCRARLAGYKRPKDVFVVSELPMTATGKLMRSALAQHLGLARTAT
jgi:long-chain acyl-CoA synthetase